jgi:hypothetical protein
MDVSGAALVGNAEGPHFALLWSGFQMVDDYRRGYLR